MSHSRWAVALLLALNSWATAADSSQLLASGDEALTKFDLTKATAAYRGAVKLEPNSTEANWKLARALADAATLEKNAASQKALCVEAQDYARAAVRLDPKSAKAHTYLAIVVGKLGLYEGGKRKVELSKEVKTEAERAIELNPQEDLPYHVLGIWHREMAQLNWMLKAFAEFLYGKFPPASLATAESNLKRATELAPTVVAHRVELGITLMATRRWTEAKTALDAAIKMPKGWVTDDYYKAQATAALERVNAHLK